MVNMLMMHRGCIPVAQVLRVMMADDDVEDSHGGCVFIGLLVV